MLYLLSNAAKFTKNGTVKLSVSLAEGRGKVNAANPSVIDSSIPAGEARTPIAIACPLPNFQQSDWICSQLAVVSCQLSVVNSQQSELPITNYQSLSRVQEPHSLAFGPNSRCPILNSQLPIANYLINSQSVKLPMLLFAVPLLPPALQPQQQHDYEQDVPGTSEARKHC